MNSSRRRNVVFLTQVIGIGQAADTVPAELSAVLEAGRKKPAQAGAHCVSGDMDDPPGTRFSAEDARRET
jgi:hypothetical protein